VPDKIKTPEEIPGKLNLEQLLALIKYEDAELTDELPTMDSYRDYYEGDQDLTYATEEFRRAYGDTFPEFRTNWCEVIIDATEERIGIDRIIFRDKEGDEPDLDSTNEIWKILHDNDLPEIENVIYNSALVESRSAVIVWPDEELGARVDAQKAQNIRVSYDPDDYRKISHAIKRWATPAGEFRLTLYTPEYIYKFYIPPTSTDPNSVALDDIGEVRENTSGESEGWIPRPTSETGDDEWPLTNPFGEVPVVEFAAKSNISELKNVVPLQDALNKTMVNMLVAGDFAGTKQAFVVSSNSEPDGGWKRRPGIVWHLTPEVDIDGRPLPTQVGTIDETDPDVFIAIIETLLQHASQQTKTPTYYFFQTSSGGQRGDAPSGDSLRVTETSLVKKIGKYQENWGSSWVKIARLIWKARNIGSSGELPDIGQVSWRNPQSHFLGLLLEEGRRMVQDLYLPPEYAWRHIGLSEVEIAEAKKKLEEDGPIGLAMSRFNTNVNIEEGESSSEKSVTTAGVSRSQGKGMKQGTNAETTNR